MPLGRRLSKANLIGMIGSLTKYTKPDPVTRKVEALGVSQAKDALMNMLLDYIDDQDITLNVWKSGLQTMLSNDLKKQAEDIAKTTGR